MIYMINSIGIVKADVLKALEIMGYGVLAIFIVIAILIIIVQLMSKIEKSAEKAKSAEGYKPAGEKIKDKFAALKEKRGKGNDEEETAKAPDDQPKQ